MKERKSLTQESPPVIIVIFHLRTSANHDLTERGDEGNGSVIPCDFNVSERWERCGREEGRGRVEAPDRALFSHRLPMQQHLA